MYTSILDVPMEELELGVRAWNILKRRGLDTCGDVLSLTAQDLNAFAADGHSIGLAGARQVAEAQDWLIWMRRRCTKCWGGMHSHYTCPDRVGGRLAV